MQDVGFSDDDITTIHNTVEKYKPQVQLAIAKLDGDRSFFYGVQLDENGKAGTIDNAEAAFEIGSISKVFTSTLLAQLVVEGKVALEDDIGKHLGFPMHRGATISLLELANHTSGLSRLPPGMMWKALFGSTENPYKSYTTDHLEYDLQTRIKLKKKGKARYSNIGAGALGHIVGKIDNTSYEEALSERIFKPLDMNNSTGSRQRFSGLMVEGRGKNGKPVGNWDFDALAGAGSIISTVSDLAKFAYANFDTENQAFQLQQKPTTKMNFMDQVGLGWMIQSFKTTGDRPWHWHNGGTGGYSSAMVLDIPKKTGVIILSNVSGLYFLKSQEITNLAFKLHGAMVPGQKPA